MVGGNRGQTTISTPMYIGGLTPIFVGGLTPIFADLLWLPGNRVREPGGVENEQRLPGRHRPERLLRR